MDKFSWNIESVSKKSKARTGIIKTPHGKIETPAFIFCATKAALKTLNPRDIKGNGTQIILSNTYHLMLQPGSSIISEHGGLHKFMNWKGPMLTDSGGFQIFSLGHGSVAQEIKSKSDNKYYNKTLIKIDEEGALFKSYLDGSIHLLTPEKSIKIQRDLGPDIILVLDECTPFHVNKKYTNDSMLRSHRWAKRSINYFNSKYLYKPNFGSAGEQRMYGIIQGGIYEDLRDESIEFNLNEIDVFGIAIGGSLGSTKEEMYKIVNYTGSKLGLKHPVHLLGIGDPKDIWHLVKSGIDTFDCVSPTRLARHGSALVKTKVGKINLNNNKYFGSKEAIDKNCMCETCRNFSASYIHHLLKTKELLGLQLLSLHNVFFINEMMKCIRKAIKEDRLDKAQIEWFEN